MAETPVAAQIQSAVRLFGEGQALAARDRLERASPQSVEETLAVTRATLEICLHSQDAACVARHAAGFAGAAARAPSANPTQRARLALEAAYYVDAARWLAGEAPAEILAEPSWKHEIAYDGELYLRRQVLAANLLLAAGRRDELERTLDKILSLTAALKNPQAARFTVAASLADVIATLLAAGETDRAYGVWRAAGAEIGQTLPPLSLDAALYQLTAGRLLQQVGDVEGARTALQAASATLRRIELPPAVRRSYLAQALTLEAALDIAAGDKAAARAALADHPFAALYATPGRTPGSLDEITYLAARSFVAALDGDSGDPIAAAALQAHPTFAADPETQAEVAIYQAAGLALAGGPGPQRKAQLVELGRRLREYAAREEGFGRLDRLDSIAQILVGMALSQADSARSPTEADTFLTLFQLAGRTGASFDADALAALGQARDELQQRTIHEGLRLRARRDRLERDALRTATAALRGAPEGGLLAHDASRRMLLRDYDERLANAEARLARDGISLDGPRLTSLAGLQAVLRPDEAALALAPTFGGFAYMCVRRDRTFEAVAPADFRQLKVDAKIVQAALTATHPASEALDIQFPAEAAVRLYGLLLKPFEPCLRAGDRLIWLGGVAQTSVPLGALLARAPPRIPGGYDLSAADWVVRRHAVSYAGSAAALAAQRSRPSAPPADLDFLGVGAPRLDGRLAGLRPLPETRVELESSARGFARADLLLDGAATEGALRSRLLGDYRYLSFATHGLLRDELADLSEPALVLTPAAGAGPRDDGLLTASEIADLDLHARFVALSACNTANYDFDRIAQDLPALASAFEVAGARSTLGSLWPVDSRTGELVVSGVFARLRAGGAGAADALAEAQRAFLAAPPSRAHLHPRFWAPFVVLGDARPDPAVERSAARPALVAIETLTGPGGGEVLALAEAPGGVAARFIAEPDSAGRHGEGVRLAGPQGETWRRVDREGGASRLLAALGPRLLAGGYTTDADGRTIPQLQAYDLDGAPAGAWTGAELSSLDAGILASAAFGPSELVLVAGEVRRHGETTPARLHVLRAGLVVAPRPLFDITPPADVDVSSATITPLKSGLLLTYSANRLPPSRAAFTLDDYDDLVCREGRATWVELRDRETGRVLKSARIEGVVIVAAAASGHGVLLGGSRRDGCQGEFQATVLELDAGLTPRTLYLDQALGASEVRALTPLVGGGAFVAAYKESLADLSFAAPIAPMGPLIQDGVRVSTVVFALDRHGRAQPGKTLDAGFDVIPTALLVRGEGEVLLGGALGGQAAILHVDLPR